MNFILPLFFMFITQGAISQEITDKDIEALDRLGDFPRQEIILTNKDHIHRFTTAWYRKYEYKNTRLAILKARSILTSLRDKKSQIQNQREIVVQIRPNEFFKREIEILDKDLNPVYVVDSRQLTLIDDVINLKPEPEEFTLAENEQAEFVNPAYYLHWDLKYYLSRYRVEPYRELFQANASDLFSQKAKANLFIRGKLPIYFGLTGSILNESFSPGEDNRVNRVSFFLGPMVKTPSYRFWQIDFSAFMSFEKGFWEKLSASEKDLIFLDSDILETGIEAKKKIFGQSWVFGLTYFRQWLAFESDSRGINVDSDNNIFDGWSFFMGAQFTIAL